MPTDRVLWLWVPDRRSLRSLVRDDDIQLFGATAWFRQNPRSLHRAFVVEAVLIVLDDGGDRLQRQLAVCVFDHVRQVEILDRDVVVAVFEAPAQRLKNGLLPL